MVASPVTESYLSVVGRIHAYVRDTSRQHRVQQFFTENEIHRQLHEFHTQLKVSYTVSNQVSSPFDYPILANFNMSSHSLLMRIIRKHMTQLRMQSKKTAH